MWIQNSDGSLVNLENVVSISIEDAIKGYQKRVVAMFPFLFEGWPMQTTLYRGSQEECQEMMSYLKLQLRTISTGPDGTKDERRSEFET